MLDVITNNDVQTKPMPQYDYRETVAASERVYWRIEDIFGGDKKLDFTKPLMPESLARVEELSFLNDDEKRTLNQIRGHAYLAIFGLVEEFILPFVLDTFVRRSTKTIIASALFCNLPAKKPNTSSFSNASARNFTIISEPTAG